MLLIHVERPSPRAHYTIGHVVGRMLGWPFRIVPMEEFRSATGPKLHYGNDDPADAYRIRSSGWLEERGVVPFEPLVDRSGRVPVLFPQEQGHDPFAAVFYLISRYEEYVTTERDEHGRIPSKALFLVRHDLEQRPLADLWALDLARALRERYPQLPAPGRSYRHTVTIDVDNGLRYLGRPVWRQLAAIVRDLLRDHRTAMERWSVIRGRAADPFDRYQEVVETAAHAHRTIFFFLMRGGGAFDHAADHRHPLMRKAMITAATCAEAGLHPSYHSSTDTSLIAGERDLLQAAAKSGIQCTRQHFLRCDLPATLRAVEGTGMVEEHSCGLADRPGFRAGTCTPFQWYDLLQERVSGVEMHPFVVMDSALHDRMGLGAGAAIPIFERFVDAVREVDGDLTTVWHDRFLSDHGPWKGWYKVFDRVIRYAAS